MPSDVERGGGKEPEDGRPTYESVVEAMYHSKHCDYNNVDRVYVTQRKSAQPGAARGRSGPTMNRQGRDGKDGGRVGFPF